MVEFNAYVREGKGVTKDGSTGSKTIKWRIGGQKVDLGAGEEKFMFLTNILVTPMDYCTNDDDISFVISLPQKWHHYMYSMLSEFKVAQ